MEIAESLDECKKLRDNLVFMEDETSISMKNTRIRFEGTQNLLYFEGGVMLDNCNFLFSGSNAIIYLSQNKSVYCFGGHVANDSVIYLGKNIYMNPSAKLQMIATEQQNILMGGDSIVAPGVCMRTADPHLVYDCHTKQRLNFSKSILIGDHVWIGQNAMILKGSMIGSGSIVGGNCVVANKTVLSNVSVAGNPMKVIRKDVFFTRDCVHNYVEDDTLQSQVFPDDRYVYQKSKETLDLKEVDENLKGLKTYIEKMAYLKQVFIEETDKNRFFIGD